MWAVSTWFEVCSSGSTVFARTVAPSGVVGFATINFDLGQSISGSRGSDGRSAKLS